MDLDLAQQFDAILFDLDGVITDTAAVHASAWKQLFDDYLRGLADAGGDPLVPFDLDEDYRGYVDGKPRYEGVKSFLASRGIELPYGEPSDEPGTGTYCALGNIKNVQFNEILRRDGATVFETSVQLIRRLREAGTKVAVVSSSKNTPTILEVAGLTELFDLRFDGNDAQRLGLKGKPTPDTYQKAADLLGVPYERAVVVEDAISGVQAGRAGGFGLVIGVDRHGEAEALRTHGADVVVADLGELLHADEAGAMKRQLADLPSALASREEIEQRLRGKRPVVFLDYDGTLTPIVSRPELAVLSEEMRQKVKDLATRCTVAVVSGRDRPDVEALVGVEGLVIAGSHGFDIASPDGETIQHDAGADFADTIAEAKLRATRELEGIEGSLVEPKKSSVAVHYRLVAEEDVPRIRAVVDGILADHPDLRVTPGKKVWEIQPRIDWNKGKAVLWLLEALKLDAASVVPFYFGDDVTDEDAFGALEGLGISIYVGHPGDEESRRETVADYVLRDPEEVGRFMETLAR